MTVKRAMKEVNISNKLIIVENGEEALKYLRNEKNEKPCIILLDLNMPKMNGIEATTSICAKAKGMKVIILSMHSVKRFVTRALKAGAHGYMIKDCAAEELVRAIRAVVANQIYLSPIVSRGVVEEYLHHLEEMDSGIHSILTSREREILQLIAEGKNTREIASTLNLSPKTIETYRHRIMIKLKIDNIAGLTRHAIQEGVIFLES